MNILKKDPKEKPYIIYDLNTCQDNVPTTKQTCTRFKEFDSLKDALDYSKTHLGIWKILDKKLNIPIFRNTE